MKRMFLMFFFLVWIFSIQGFAVDTDFYRIDDPPGVEYQSCNIDQPMDFPQIFLVAPIQVFDWKFDQIRLPEVDDWPISKSAEPFGHNNVSPDYFYFVKLSLRCFKPNAKSPILNETQTITQKPVKLTKCHEWVKSYNISY